MALPKWMFQKYPPHVYPTEDLRDHVLVGLECWCHPAMDEGVIIHNAMDRREEYETGRKMS
jgi:hypothetical protein